MSVRDGLFDDCVDLAGGQAGAVDGHLLVGQQGALHQEFPVQGGLAVYGGPHVVVPAHAVELVLGLGKTVSENVYSGPQPVK